MNPQSFTSVQTFHTHTHPKIISLVKQIVLLHDILNTISSLYLYGSMATDWEGTANPLVIIPQPYFLSRYHWIHRNIYIYIYIYLYTCHLMINSFHCWKISSIQGKISSNSQICMTVWHQTTACHRLSLGDSDFTVRATLGETPNPWQFHIHTRTINILYTHIYI